jgi:hypothetical protein
VLFISNNQLRRRFATVQCEVGDHEYLEGDVLHSNGANKSILVRKQEGSFESHWLQLSLRGALREIDIFYFARSPAAILHRVRGLALGMVGCSRRLWHCRPGRSIAQ